MLVYYVRRSQDELIEYQMEMEIGCFKMMKENIMEELIFKGWVVRVCWGRKEETRYFSLFCYNIPCQHLMAWNNNHYILLPILWTKSLGRAQQGYLVSVWKQEDSTGVTWVAGNNWDRSPRAICLGLQFFLKWHLLRMEYPNGSFICTSDPLVEMSRTYGAGWHCPLSVHLT